MARIDAARKVMQDGGFARKGLMMNIITDKHPSGEVLEDYVRHKLPPSKALGVEEHLLICESCQDAVADSEAVIQGLTMALDPPNASRFHTHLPLYSLQAAAGRFGEQQMIVDPERWVKVPSSHNIHLTREMFVIHAKGFSMEPSISDGSLCVFKGNVNLPYEGKVVLLEEYGETGGNRYAVKRYHASSNLDPNQKGDAAWLHERMTLESTNTEYESWDVASAGKVHIIGEFLFTL
jgi:hypothetical protein